MYGITARVALNVPVRFTSIRRCQSLSSTVCSGRRSPVPALLTRMSIWPSVCATRVDRPRRPRRRRARRARTRGRRPRPRPSIAPSPSRSKHRDRRALGREPARGRGADPRRAAGDDRDPSVELRHARRIYGVSRDRCGDHSAGRAPRRGRTPTTTLGVLRPYGSRRSARPPRARRRPRRGARAAPRSRSRPSRRAAANGLVPAQRVVRGRRGRARCRRRRGRTPPRAASRPTDRRAARARSRASSTSASVRREPAAPRSTALRRSSSSRSACERARPQHAVGDGEMDRALVAVQRVRAAGGGVPSAARTRRTRARAPTRARAAGSCPSASVATTATMPQHRAARRSARGGGTIAASVSGWSVGIPTMRSSRAISRSRRAVITARHVRLPRSNAPLTLNSSSRTAPEFLSDASSVSLGRYATSGDDLEDHAVIARELRRCRCRSASRAPGC